MQTQQVSDAATQVNAVVDHLAAKLSVPVTHLWGVLMREAYVEGIRDVLAAVMCLIGAGICSYLFRICARKAGEARFGDELGWEFGTIGCVLAVAGLTISAAVNLYNAVPALVNPEYVALQGIVSAIRP